MVLYFTDEHDNELDFDSNAVPRIDDVVSIGTVRGHPMSDKRYNVVEVEWVVTEPRLYSGYTESANSLKAKVIVHLREETPGPMPLYVSGDFTGKSTTHVSE